MWLLVFKKSQKMQPNADREGIGRMRQMLTEFFFLMPGQPQVSRRVLTSFLSMGQWFKAIAPLFSDLRTGHADHTRERDLRRRPEPGLNNSTFSRSPQNAI